MTNIETVKQLVGRGYAGNPQYREAMIHMRFEEFSDEDIEYFKDLYATSKDIFSRNQILQAFVLLPAQHALKDFFLGAFKKERYLDMRLTAIRGYAASAAESEVIPLMKKFVEILIKIPTHTPYNYQEYEMLRSEFGLPYLVKQYEYACFKQALEQLNKQYDAMPDLYKGLFTLDKNGLPVSLAAPEEVKARLDKLFAGK